MHNIPYILALIIIFIGLSGIVISKIRFRKIFSLTIFQLGIMIIYVLSGYIENASIPILSVREEVYANPLPHVLMLTAIVVSIATTALGLAFSVKIKNDI